MKTEKQLYNAVKRLAAFNKVGCYKLHCESQSGWPDVFLIYEGRIALVELKSPAKTGRVSPVQKVMIERLTNQGATVYVCNSIEQINAIIEILIDG